MCAARFNEIFSKATYSSPQIVRTYWDDGTLDLEEIPTSLIAVAIVALACICRMYRETSARAAQYELLGTAKRNRSLADCEDEV